MRRMSRREEEVVILRAAAGCERARPVRSRNSPSLG
jgi:hypothetical protein